MRKFYAEVYKSGTDSVVAGTTGSLKDGQCEWTWFPWNTPSCTSYGTRGKEFPFVRFDSLSKWELSIDVSILMFLVTVFSSLSCINVQYISHFQRNNLSLKLKRCQQQHVSNWSQWCWLFKLISFFYFTFTPLPAVLILIFTLFNEALL